MAGSKLIKKKKTLPFSFQILTFMVRFLFCAFLNYWKKTRICSTGLETGCKPVLFHIYIFIFIFKEPLVANELYEEEASQIKRKYEENPRPVKAVYVRLIF